MNNKIDELSIATIRSLCIDIINKANSGHPGMALGSAPILYTLFTRHLIASPIDSTWINRDRFVLSAGHASSLLYAMLHLCGYKISLDDLKSFRQLDSLTPGHPEYLYTDGVDATSGPLGQGIAQAVGMALAERSLSSLYENSENIINHYTYALCGDGCLQEGISQEAISFAGHQKLNKLILIYDNNDVTLDGGLNLSFSENVKMRFESASWQVLEVSDGNDVTAIDEAIKKAKKSQNKPTLIIVKTVIGYGSSKQGTSKVHGSPLGLEDGKATKVNAYNFDYPDFYIPVEVKAHFKQTFNDRNDKIYNKWQNDLKEYEQKHAHEALRFKRLMGLSVKDYLPDVEPNFDVNDNVSTRTASGKALNAYMLSIPNLFGGSADVAGSVMTKLNDGVNLTFETPMGHNINFGIREFAMCAIMNGALLHGGVRMYAGCFFVFSDYCKPAIRMAALSHLPAIYLFSHDSIMVGEDGPTHQPIEQLAMLRAIPHLSVIRPADERETFAAWHLALLSEDKPTAIILSRQNLPLLKNSNFFDVSKGGYIISKEENREDFELIATGSEVSLAIEAQEKLKQLDIDVRVISLPSWDLFLKQDKTYIDSVISLSKDKRLSIELGSTFGWDKFATYHLGFDEFGTSAPAKDIIKKYNFTADRVVDMVKSILGK